MKGTGAPREKCEIKQRAQSSLDSIVCNTLSCAAGIMADRLAELGSLDKSRI